MNRSTLPPGPKSAFPLAHLFNYRKDSLGFLRKVADEFGDVVGFNFGPIRIVLLNHPDFIKEVLTTQHRNFVKGRPLEMAKELIGEGLLTSEGEFHKRQSRIIQPAFHRNMIESYVPAVTNCVQHVMKNWRDDMQVDIKDSMTNMAIAIAGKTFFDADLELEASEISNALDASTSLFGRISLPFSEWLLRLPLPGSLRFKKARSKLDKIIYRMIDERRGQKNAKGDLMSLLLFAEEESGETGSMTRQQLRDEALTLLLTAFDTTSTAMTWTWYLLSQNPDAEAELHKEIDSVLNGRLPVAEDVPRLRYTKMVLGESMRLYPPSYVIARQALEDFNIDKYIIPGGTIILMSPYLIQRDPRFYEKPENFDPRNWEKHFAATNSRYEYFPFSRGPRACIGEPLAWMQGIIVLASIAQSWQLKLVKDHPVELLPLINLRSKYGMKMKTHRRNNT